MHFTLTLSIFEGVMVEYMSQLTAAAACFSGSIFLPTNSPECCALFHFPLPYIIPPFLLHSSEDAYGIQDSCSLCHLVSTLSGGSYYCWAEHVLLMTEGPKLSVKENGL